jgi:hypothetical protein
MDWGLALHGGTWRLHYSGAIHPSIPPVLPTKGVQVDAFEGRLKTRLIETYEPSAVAKFT